jgi:hypothetical protein
MPFREVAEWLLAAGEGLGAGGSETRPTEPLRGFGPLACTGTDELELRNAGKTVGLSAK